LKHARIWFDSPIEQQEKKRTRENNKQHAHTKQKKQNREADSPLGQDKVRHTIKEIPGSIPGPSREKKNPRKQREDRTTHQQHEAKMKCGLTVAQ
jgi:hypothetical protein